MTAELPSLPSRSLLLVGRDRELAALHVQLANAVAGRGSLVLISGEAGVGKTALMDVFAHEAGDAGARVLFGNCYDRSKTPPYGPWIESLTRRTATDRGSFPPLPAPPLLAAAPNRDVLFTRMREYFAMVAAEYPLVLVLEDLHWADTVSLDLLRFLARGLASLPLLIIVTYRDDELDRVHPLAEVIPLLVREAPVARLALRPLDAVATRALVDAHYRLSDNDAARLAAFMVGHTEGNALYITELLRTLEEERFLHYEHGQWRVEPLTYLPLPILIKQIVDARLARLGDEVAALLGIAAVIGHEVPLVIWKAVTTADEETLGTLAERAEAAHLVTIWEDGCGIRFTHALIHKVLYEDIPALRRRRMHRQVGEVLAALSALDPDAVAYHFQQAGDERAAAWLTRAGERAEDAQALVAAAERYETAFTLLDAQQGDASERGWLRLLAASLRNYQRPEPALVWVEEVVRLAKGAGDASLAARAQAMHGLLQCYRGDFRVGMADLQSARDVIDQLPPVTPAVRRREEQIDRIANRGTLTAFLAYLGHLAKARVQGERHLATMSTSVPTPAQLGAVADVHTGLSLVYAMQGESALARRSYAACIAAYERINHSVLMLMKQREELIFAVLPYMADDLAERERVAAVAEGTASRLIAAGTRDDTDLPVYARIPLLVLEGHWREARQILERPDTANITRNSHFRNFMLGPLARAQGDAERAWRCVHEVWPDGPTTKPGNRFVEFTLPLQLLAAVLALDAGDLATPRAWLDAHRRWLDFAGATLGRSEGELLEAEWHRASGDVTRAYQHAELALVHATAPRQPLALLAAHRMLGILDGEGGRVAEAERHFVAALALADACRVPYERTLTLLALADLLTSSDRRMRAQAALDEARMICLPMDAHLALTYAERIAARLTATANRLPAGLSPRELDVLRLIAAGLSNAAIADRLFVSPRTVKVHVANIYRKLGVANRADAARVAADYDLT